MKKKKMRSEAVGLPGSSAGDEDYSPVIMEEILSKKDYSKETAAINARAKNMAKNMKQHEKIAAPKRAKTRPHLKSARPYKK